MSSQPLSPSLIEPPPDNSSKKALQPMPPKSNSRSMPEHLITTTSTATTISTLPGGRRSDNVQTHDRLHTSSSGGTSDLSSLPEEYTIKYDASNTISNDNLNTGWDVTLPPQLPHPPPPSHSVPVDTFWDNRIYSSNQIRLQRGEQPTHRPGDSLSDYNHNSHGKMTSSALPSSSVNLGKPLSHSRTCDSIREDKENEQDYGHRYDYDHDRDNHHHYQRPDLDTHHSENDKAYLRNINANHHDNRDRSANAGLPDPSVPSSRRRRKRSTLEKEIAQLLPDADGAELEGSGAGREDERRREGQEDGDQRGQAREGARKRQRRVERSEGGTWRRILPRAEVETDMGYYGSASDLDSGRSERNGLRITNEDQERSCQIGGDGYRYQYSPNTVTATAHPASTLALAEALVGSGPTTRYDFGLEDVEAALTIQYLARDTRMPVPPPYTSHALQPNQWSVGPDRYEGDQKQEVSGRWGLGSGICSNCRVDETEAVCWWTDPVVKTVLGLNRRLCYACGVFKYNNLVDRPVNIGRQVLQNLAPPLSTSDRPIQTQPCPNHHSQAPLRTVGPPHPNIPYTNNMGTVPSNPLIREIVDCSDRLYIFPPASYGIPIKPYSKVQGGWYDQGLTGQGEIWQPEIQHISWAPM